MEAKNNKTASMEIYIHIPFCAKKCEYCDFLSGPAGGKEQRAYVQALLKEIRAAEEGQGRSVSSIFIGGGTPSLLKEDLLGSILNEIYKKFNLEPGAEISIEVNPGTVSSKKLEAYRRMGINRLSIGLQSTDDRELKTLGRLHNYAQFLETYQAAGNAGFDNINIDLMSALPDQTYEGWVANLRRTAELSPAHISAYSLIIEEGTPFAMRELNLPDEETEYRMYEDTAAILEEYGYEQYEISNYAKKGRRCRHNVGYWTRCDYLGLGLGAASLWGKKRFSNTADMEEYLRNSAFPGRIRLMEPVLSREDEMAEFMFLGLRMTEGVSEAAFRQGFGVEMREIYGEVLKKYTGMELLEEKDGRIFLTRKGIHVSNSVMSDFLLETS
ncbi:MAG: radical SAM family heme chaperone HemW [Eubacteriales bacterium]|nr:radical SAM family heme chaperone HemW [Eubacteriales bacterium]